MRVGLLLGGGGTVGIAWENGVLAGLQDACGFRAADATVIVGTSAGSAVGADVALGKDPHDALDLGASESRALGKLKPPDREKGPFAEILKLLMSNEERTPEWVARVGALALNADTFLTEEQFVESFRRTIGSEAWPDVDLRITAASCTTGRPKVWSAADGIPLTRAVASSCAIPGFFPAISFEDEHYFDGSRGRDYHAAIVRDLELDVAIYVGPRIQVAGVEKLIRDDMAAIEATGVRVYTIFGSEKLDVSGVNLMDGSKRTFGFEVGLEDGAMHAETIGPLLAGG